MGCDCHSGAGGGERGWWLAKVSIYGFLLVPVCVFFSLQWWWPVVGVLELCFGFGFFFFFFLWLGVEVMGGGSGCWQWQWVCWMRLRIKNNKKIIF